jgi:PIN domain nuclease of toxin-antitoxin system
VTIWEIAMLVDRGRVTLDGPIEAWTTRFLDRPGIEGVPLGVSAAMRGYQLHAFENRDPADRLLIATAIDLGCPLVTYDSRIRRFGDRYGERHGFSTVA